MPKVPVLPAGPLAVFRQAYFGPIDQYLAWHDGYEADFACLDALTPNDRAQATSELLAALRAGTADARAVLGLGHLRCEDALPLLHHLLRQGIAAFYDLLAIAQINPAGLYQPLLVELLFPKTGEYQLIDLLAGLREYFTLPQLGIAIARRVFALLTHREYLVRYHALNTLRRLYHLQAADQQRSNDIAAVRRDELFSLIITDKKPADFCRAQQLLLAQLPTAEREALQP